MGIFSLISSNSCLLSYYKNEICSFALSLLAQIEQNTEGGKF
jgi:hypothetical protein